MQSKELHNKLQRLNQHVYLYGLFYVAFLLLLLLLDLPAVIQQFAFHDDYYYFAYDNHESFKYHPQYAAELIAGRQLAAVVATPMGWLIERMADFSLVRCIFIAALAAAALLLTRMLIRLQMEWWYAASVVLGICLLPGLQVGVLWVTLAPTIAALILSLLSASFITSVELDHLLSPGRRVRTLACVAGAIVTLIIALFIYPTWAMFFLVPLFAYLSLETARGAKRIFGKLVVAGFIFVCSIGIYFCLHRFVFEPIYRLKFATIYAQLQQSSYSFKLSTNISWKLNEFFHAVFDSLNLWNIYPRQSLSTGIEIIVLLGAVASLLSLRRGLSIAEWALRAVGLVLLLFGALLPSLAAANANVTPYRVMAPLAAMLTIAVYVSIGFLLNTLPLPQHTRNGLRYLAVIVLTLLAACASSINVGLSAANSALEFRLLQSAVAEHIHRGENFNRVHIVLLGDGPSLLGLPGRFDEFNVNTLSDWSDTPWVLRAVLLELGAHRAAAKVYPTESQAAAEPAEGRLVFTRSLPGAPYQVPPGTIVIDMNDFVRPSPADVRAHCCGLASKSLGTH